MKRIKEPNIDKTVVCEHCGGTFEFDYDDIEMYEINISQRELFVKCPYCKRKKYVTKMFNRRR